MFKQRMTALYAAPSALRPKKPDGTPETNEGAEYPRNYDTPDNAVRPPMDEIVDVYAGPMPAEPEEPEEPEEVKEPEAPFMPPQPPMMMVYAGPDYFANKNNSIGGFAFPGMAQDEGEKKQEQQEEAPETEEERMQRLMEEFSKNPPQMCGIVQASPETIGQMPGGFLDMKMGTAATPNYCPHCGTKTVKGDKFCRECGESLIK